MARLDKKELSTIVRKTIGFDLPIHNTVHNYAWKGVIALKTDSNNKLSFVRIGKDDAESLRDDKGKLPDGYFDADTADELLSYMLVYALKDNLVIDRGAMFIPDVCDLLDRDVKTLPTKKIKDTLKNYLTTGDNPQVEVFLKSAYSAKTQRSWPSLVVRKLGSKPSGNGGTKNRLGGLSLAK
jgi:hypothetical protein